VFRALCFHDARKKDHVTQWLQNQTYNQWKPVRCEFEPNQGLPLFSSARN